MCIVMAILTISLYKPFVDSLTFEGNPRYQLREALKKHKEEKGMSKDPKKNINKDKAKKFSDAFVNDRPTLTDALKKLPSIGDLFGGSKKKEEPKKPKKEPSKTTKKKLDSFRKGFNER